MTGACADELAIRWPYCLVAEAIVSSLTHTWTISQCFLTWWAATTVGCFPAVYGYIRVLGSSVPCRLFFRRISC